MENDTNVPDNVAPSLRLEGPDLNDFGHMTIGNGELVIYEKELEDAWIQSDTFDAANSQA